MSRKPKRRKSKSQQRQAHQFSTLEPRKLLAGITFDSATGVITVEGSSQDDFVQLTEVGSEIQVDYQGVESQSFSASTVNGVKFYGYSGDDWFRNATTISAEAHGHSGNDRLLGGADDDRLLGGKGDDYLVGGAGDDYLNGHEDFDRVLGNSGDDILLGGDGDDRVVGGEGDDFMRGGNGADSMFGLDGDDWVEGGADDDLIIGNAGRDRLSGEAGNDRILGGDGDDRINGDDGDDWVYAGRGDDHVSGDAGSDRLVGHAGLDEMFGNLGNDFLYGNDDNDVLRGNEGEDVVIGGSGDDHLYGDEDDDFLNGQVGNDKLFAGQGDDYLRGESGRDDLYGGDGDDSLDGGEDNDDLDGGRDSDWMRGGHGNDDYGEDESDRLDDDNDDYDASDDFEIRGPITELDAASQTFRLLGLSVSYAEAEVEGDLADGLFVKVEGAFDGQLLTAREVEPETDEHDENFEVSGLIANLDTIDQSFELFGIPVSYAGAEVDGEIFDGAFVKVEGDLANGVVTADEVESDRFDDSDGHDSDSDGNVELRASIQNLDLQAQTFELLGITIDYSGAEIQGEIANGAFFKAEGFFDGEKLIAREVESELDDNRDENFEARGRVSNLDTAASTFSFLGFTVDYSDAELETTLADGDSVKLEGFLNGLLVSADKIEG